MLAKIFNRNVMKRLKEIGYTAGKKDDDILGIEDPKEEVKKAVIEAPRYLLTTKASAQKMENCPNKS